MLDQKDRTIHAQFAVVILLGTASLVAAAVALGLAVRLFLWAMGA
ncbi:MAG: hypothetical protein AB7U18_00255 [Dehalococcoidia bacterium]